MGFARAAKVELQHVKAHGALYNMAAVNRELAAAIAHARRTSIAHWCSSVFPAVT